MEHLKISILQTNIIWEDICANLEKYTTQIAEIGDVDVIILPEMFTTGFSMEPQNLKENMDGRTVTWMKKIASQKNAAILGSLIIEEHTLIFNRAVWIYPDGRVEIYDKRHLFTMGQEHLHYSAGHKKTIISYKGWKFCPLICYDLRFPVWARNTEDYDVLIYLANWPSVRHRVWKNLLVSRAIENQTYCFGINRVGEDGMGLSYFGDSAFISPKGNAEFAGRKETIRTFEISYTELHSFRNKFPVLNDKDSFSID